MSLNINTNIASLNAQRNLDVSQSALRTSLQRLSSGLRVNSAKDDAAGLAIGSRMDAQARGQAVAIRNANDGISLAQTAEGGLATIGDALQRMRELTVQSLNGTNTAGDRTNLDAEYQTLSAQITNIAAATKFNGTALLSAGATFTFQTGANTGEINSVTTTTVATVGGSIATSAGAATALAALDTSIDTINTNRAAMGAAQNQLSYAISNLQISHENQTAARSRIMDADFASETAALTRGQVLQQAGTAMLAQANALPNNVLSLLR